jgi:WD40 repeat protein
MHDRIFRIEFSPKGTLIAILGMGRVKIFDAVTGASLTTFDVQEKHVGTIALSSGDNFLVSGFRDGTIGVLDVQTGNPIQTFNGHTDEVRSVAFSPCGTMIASGADDKTVRVWNIFSGCCECCLEGHSGEVLAVCWSTKGSQVISGSSDTTVRIWDISEQACSNVIYGHTKLVTSVASCQDMVASGSDDETIKIYDLHSGDIIQTISTDNWVYSVQFSVDGEKLMYTYGNSAAVRDLGKRQQVLHIKLEGFRAIFSPDVTRVASHYGTSVKICKTEGVYLNPTTDDHHSQEVTSISFASYGQLVISRSYGESKIWDTASGECLFTFNNGYYGNASVGFSPNSEFIAYQSHKEWRVWNVRSRRLIKEVDCGTSFHVAISSDGTYIASISHSRIRLWSLPAGKCLAQLGLDDLRRMSTVYFGADGSSVLVTAEDGCTKTWRISPASLLDRDPTNETASLPMVLVPIHEEWSHPDTSAPSQWYHYKEGDAWIVDQNGVRMLWVPPDRRGYSIDIHGKKVALGTWRGRVCMVDFPDAPHIQASSSPRILHSRRSMRMCET